MPQREIDRIVRGDARESSETSASQSVSTRTSPSDSGSVRNLDQDYAEKIRNFVWASEEERERCSIFMGLNAHHPVRRLAEELSLAADHPQRHRQVKPGAFLAQIGRRQVDGHALAIRKLETAVSQR